MAHTIMKQIYDDERKKYIECEVLVFDEEEGLPEGTDRREIILSCTDKELNFLELDDEFVLDIESTYPETELIDQYKDFDNHQGY